MKKINLILIGIGVALTIKYGFGMMVIIPIVLYYLKKDFKCVYYLLPSLVITTAFINPTYLIALLSILIIQILSYFLIEYLKKVKINQNIYCYIILIISYFVSIIFIRDSKFLMQLIYLLISILIYSFLIYEDYLYIKNINKTPSILAEHLIVIFAVVGFSKFNLYNIQLGIFLSIYFSIYYSRTFHNIYSLLLGIILFLIQYLIFDLNESVIILLVSMIYLTGYRYVFFLLNVILIVLTFTDMFNSVYLYVVMVLSIGFEFIWAFVLNKKEVKVDLVEISKHTIEKEYTSFALFLEFFIQTFKNSTEYSNQLSKALNMIVDKHCMACRSQSECFKKYKSTITYNLKDVIESKPNSEFKNFCSSINEITRTAQEIKGRMCEKTDSFQSLILSVLNETKTVVEKYITEVNSLKIIDQSIIQSFQLKLINIIDVNKINYEKIFEDNFLIEVEVKNNLINKEETTALIQNSFLIPSSVSVIEKEDIYIFKLTPKKRINVKYGYGSLASKTNALCGDNHLIKDYENAHLLAVISDGMGKGFKAFEDSKRVIDAVDTLSYLSTSTATNIEMLNLLYIIQGYTERYSTIDAIDIDMAKVEASFYKLGASSTYIFHEDNTFTKLENKSLPLGIEEEVTKQVIKLRNNDLIILTSDGIFENILDESSILSYIIKLKKLEPQKIAYELLEYSLKQPTHTKDDMSIIVLKVESIKI